MRNQIDKETWRSGVEGHAVSISLGRTVILERQPRYVTHTYMGPRNLIRRGKDALKIAKPVSSLASSTL